MTDSITCPRCGKTSYNLNDVREGYCGNCHGWTQKPTWETNGFVSNQPTPSMDDKDTPSPPIRTVAEYHQDEAAGFVRPSYPEDHRKVKE